VTWFIVLITHGDDDLSCNAQGRHRENRNGNGRSFGLCPIGQENAALTLKPALETVKINKQAPRKKA
jgi:hypothetical protein